MQKFLTILSVALVTTMAQAQLGIPCLAQSSSEEQLVDVKEGVRYAYRQRLHDLKEQINKGLEKGWINADQSQALTAEHDRLLSETMKVKEAGWPKDSVNKLEKKVTALNARVSSALSKGLHPGSKSSAN